MLTILWSKNNIAHGLEEPLGLKSSWNLTLKVETTVASVEVEEPCLHSGE